MATMAPPDGQPMPSTQGDTQRASAVDWPPLSAHILSEAELGHPFQYPADYLACIESGFEDIDAGGDGHALSFLTTAEAIRDRSTFANKASPRHLVPFARGDNGDALFCFDGQGSGRIYVINLGETPVRARDTGSADFRQFIDAYRANMDLPAWAGPRTAR